MSLGPCISRLLEQWEPLSALFLEISEDDSSRSSQTKAKSVLKKLLSDEVKAYALFVENVIPTFENANTVLQGDRPLIHKARAIMKSIIEELCLRFVLPSVIQESAIIEIDVKKKTNLLPDSEVDVGFKCKKVVNSLSDENKKKFYKSVLQYLQEAVVYLQKKCNINSEVMIHATVADPSQKSSSISTSISFFAERFPSLLPANKDQDSGMDNLLREFRHWQASDIYLDIQGKENADEYWFRIGKVENQCGDRRFSALSRFMLGIMSIFHSNAGAERLFSIVRRNRTDFRHSMSNALIESLSICKNKWESKSFKDPIPKEVLVKAKSATAASLASGKQK